MRIQIDDANGSDGLFQGVYQSDWQTLETVLREMPLHLKSSDQAGLQGKAIFDPVGTNEYIKTELLKNPEWYPNVSIPQKYDFMGTDVDFVKGEVLIEIQFSNYPFLLNNLLRSELFYQAGTILHTNPVKAAVRCLSR